MMKGFTTLMDHVKVKQVNPLRRAARWTRDRVVKANDARRLTRRFPQLVNLSNQAAQWRTNLTPTYDAYTTHISNKLMAISLETAAFLRAWCEQLRPRRILDLGSGYSSFVLRGYAAKYPDTQVVTVDDHPHWLEITHQYLVYENQSTDQLMSWDAFNQDPHEPFDLIFHDLGSMPRRAEALPIVLQLAASSDCPIILDDMHKQRYARQVADLLGAWDHRYFDLSNYTLDPSRRFAALVCDVSPRQPQLHIATRPALATPSAA